MKILKSINQIKTYKAIVLTNQQHTNLSKTLKHFKPNKQLTNITYSYKYQPSQYQSILFKMQEIGILADSIDHHPQWELRNQSQLFIRLSTHDIGNKISLKDYILGCYIEQILHQKDLVGILCQKWNKFNVEI